jgi:hypothetical protein
MRLDRVVRVGPGETFYIPRGVPHRVVGDEPDERAASLYGGASLSLAYGYMPPTWTTLRHVLAERVSSDPVLAEQMPPRVWESADDAMIAGYLERLRRVAAEMTVADVRASLEGYRLGQPAHEAEPHLAEVLATGEMADDDLVVPRRGLSARVETSARGCRLAFAGDRAVDGPAAIRPALDYVAQRSAPFAVRDMPGRLSDTSKRKLAKKLVTEGFLRRCFQN